MPKSMTILTLVAHTHVSSTVAVSTRRYQHKMKIRSFFDLTYLSKPVIPELQSYFTNCICHFIGSL